MQTIHFPGFGGVDLVADAYGDEASPPVLLIPPAGQTRGFWRGAAEALADAGRYAICLDLRGHGGSGHSPDGRYDVDLHVSDLKAVLAHLPARAFVVAAGSGAIAAMIAAGESSTVMVSGMTLVDVNTRFTDDVVGHIERQLWLRASNAWQRDELVALMTSTFPTEPRPAGIAQLLVAFDEQPDGLLRWRGDPRAISTSMRGVGERLEAAAARIAVPAQLIRGSRNETISAAAVELLRGMIPTTEVNEIDGMGHYAGTDQDDVFNALLLEFIERHVPHAPLTYLGGSEPRILRDALGCFATGVTVVTTIDPDGKPVGLTANSFTSVSLDPPLILFSLARTSFNLPSFLSAGRFAVNVLHIGQQPVAGQFIRRDGDRFADLDWSFRVEDGCPVIGSSLASFDCTTHAVHEGGDHVIFIGEVKHAWFEPNRDPLLYFRGRYRRLHFA